MFVKRSVKELFDNLLNVLSRTAPSSIDTSIEGWVDRTVSCYLRSQLVKVPRFKVIVGVGVVVDVELICY